MMGGSDDPDWSVVFGRVSPSQTDYNEDAERDRRRDDGRKRRLAARDRRERERARASAELERRFMRKFANAPWIDDPDECHLAFAKFEREEELRISRKVKRSGTG